MEPTVSKTLMEQMFHLDFKYHIKALDTLTKVCLYSSEYQHFLLLLALHNQYSSSLVSLLLVSKNCYWLHKNLVRSFLLSKQVLQEWHITGNCWWAAKSSLAYVAVWDQLRMSFVSYGKHLWHAWLLLAWCLFEPSALTCGQWSFLSVLLLYSITWDRL